MFLAPLLLHATTLLLASIPLCTAGAQDDGEAPSLAFLAVGDVGTGDDSQRAVARAMAARALSHGADFALVLGDVFYPRGVSSRDDSKWRTTFVEPYSLEGLDMPFYIALGNHDHMGDPEAMIGWKGDDRWRLPDSYYRFEKQLGDDVTVEVFVLDTNVLLGGGRFADEQLDWLREALEESTATWRFVAGHHPLHSNGKHGGSKRLRKQLTPLFERHGVDLYLCGHDHHLELLDPECCPPQLISGAGAKTRDVERGKDTLFAARKLGFAWVRVEPEELRIEFVSRKGKTLFSRRLERATTRSAVR